MTDEEDDCLTSSGKYFLHVQGINKLRINIIVIGRFYNRDRSLEVCEIQTDCKVDKDRHCDLQQTIYVSLKYLLLGV